MARLEIPLRHRSLWVTGDILLRAELRLLLRDKKGVWKPVRFRVDSGTEMTTMPASEARRLDLAIPQLPVPGLMMAGQEVRAGVLRVQVIGLGLTEFTFPCYFLGDPSAKPAAAPRNLLGLSGVVDKIHIRFDGTAAAGAPYGHLVVEQ